MSCFGVVLRKNLVVKKKLYVDGVIFRAWLCESGFTDERFDFCLNGVGSVKC